ncbi:MAG: hypothetical protein DCC74_10485 [Proteobacteria bacterium]|nr:MAG: hypothetical protein DCC74_10485 [Pseudomonadota bacterium]
MARAPRYAGDAVGDAAARGPLARRARYLAANNALAASGVEAWVSALVGTGIKPQSSHLVYAFAAY